MLERLYPLLLAVALGALSGGWLMHQRGQARLAECQRLIAAEREHAARSLAQATERAHQQTLTLQREVEHAQSEARQQRQKAASAASAARTELERLRATLATAHSILRVPAHPAAACAGPVCTELLADCAGRYQALAEQADRLAIALRTVIAAWPHTSEDSHGR